MTQYFHYVRIAIVLLLSGGALVVWFPTISFSSSSASYLTVTFFDVGQGDSIHVVTPDGYELLIDGGPSAMVLRELAKERSFFDREIDMIVATHPDTDHVAGLVDVMERYQIGWIIETAVDSSSPAATAFASVAENEGAQIVIAKAGQVFQLGDSTTVRILSPHGDTTNWQNNSASVVVQIVYGETEFMLTGDAPVGIEKYLVSEYGSSLASDVLKLGHHGSNTSSCEEFVDAVRPQFAIVSAGKDNRYGHPHQEVVDGVKERGIEMVSTAESGTLTFLSDGKKVWQD